MSTTTSSWVGGVISNRFALFCLDFLPTMYVVSNRGVSFEVPFFHLQGGGSEFGFILVNALIIEELFSTFFFGKLDRINRLMVRCGCQGLSEKTTKTFFLTLHFWPEEENL